MPIRFVNPEVETALEELGRAQDVPVRKGTLANHVLGAVAQRYRETGDPDLRFLAAPSSPPNGAANHDQPASVRANQPTTPALQTPVESRP